MFDIGTDGIAQFVRVRVGMSRPRIRISRTDPGASGRDEQQRRQERADPLQIEYSCGFQNGAITGEAVKPRKSLL